MSFRQPRPDYPRAYPPISQGQVRGFRKKRKTPLKRRRKTNVRREIKRGELLTMPYRTFKQVSRQPNRQQIANDFLSIRQRDLLRQQQIQVKEKEQQLKQQIVIDKEKLKIQRETLSQQERRDRERARIEGERETARKDEVQRTNQLKQQELRVRAEEVRRQALKDQADNELRRLEQQKAIDINQANIRSQERLAQIGLQRQQAEFRRQSEQVRGYNEILNQRFNDGERRLGEIEAIGRQVLDDIERDRNRRVPLSSQIDIDLSPPQRPRVSPVVPPPPRTSTQPLLQEVSTDEESFPTPTIEPDSPPLPRQASSPIASRSSLIPVGQGLGSFRDPPLSEAEQQEIRDAIYGALTGGSRRTTTAPVRQPPASPSMSIPIDRIAPPPSTEIGSFIPSGARTTEFRPRPPPTLQRQMTEPSPNTDRLRADTPALNQLRIEAERLREMTRQQNERARQELIGSGGDAPIFASAIDVGDEAYPSPLALATPREAQQRTNLRSQVEEGGSLGQTIQEGIGTGGRLIAEGVGAGLSRVAGAGVDVASGVASGVGGALYDATIGQLPTSEEVGRTLTEGAIAGAGNVAGAIGGAISSALTPEPEPLEPEPERPVVPTGVSQAGAGRVEEVEEEDDFPNYTALMNLGRGKDTYTTQSRTSDDAWYLEVPEDLDDLYWTGRKNQKVAKLKKGSYLFKDFGGSDATYVNARRFNIFSDPSGKTPTGRADQFQLSLLDKPDVFKKAIRDGKIKIVKKKRIK